MKVRVPTRLISARMKQLDEDQFDMVYDYARNLRLRRSKGTGLLLSGPPGIGKSWALAALTRYAVVQSEKKGYRLDYEYISAPEVFEKFGAVGGLAETDEWRNQSWRKTLDTVPWLVIDDLGKEYRGGKLAEQVPYLLGRIVRKRTSNMLVTHISTNLPIVADVVDCVKTVYGESIVSLLKDATEMFEVQGDDRRGDG